jgi:uncharacterized membrane protein affecting hemolysin expression
MAKIAFRIYNRAMPIVIAIAIIALIAYFAFSSKAGVETETNPDLEELRIMAGNDEELVERLIRAEEKRFPGKNRHYYVKAALLRWKRDSNR